jgi:hypothetical protein
VQAMDKELKCGDVWTPENREMGRNSGMTGLIFWEEEGMHLKEAVKYLKLTIIFSYRS